jgi:CxxC-x17-CxxC domain-containing protein
MLAAFSSADHGTRRGGSGVREHTEIRSVAEGAARAGGHRQHDQKRLYRVVCSACGRVTEVPFAPRSDRPVYCRSCYNARKGR